MNPGCIVDKYVAVVFVAESQTAGSPVDSFFFGRKPVDKFEKLIFEHSFFDKIFGVETIIDNILVARREFGPVDVALRRKTQNCCDISCKYMAAVVGGIGYDRATVCYAGYVQCIAETSADVVVRQPFDVEFLGIIDGVDFFSENVHGL